MIWDMVGILIFIFGWTIRDLRMYPQPKDEDCMFYISCVQPYFCFQQQNVLYFVWDIYLLPIFLFCVRYLSAPNIYAFNNVVCFCLILIKPQTIDDVSSFCHWLHSNDLILSQFIWTSRDQYICCLIYNIWNILWDICCLTYNICINPSKPSIGISQWVHDFKPILDENGGRCKHNFQDLTVGGFSKPFLSRKFSRNKLSIVTWTCVKYPYWKWPPQMYMEVKLSEGEGVI